MSFSTKAGEQVNLKKVGNEKNRHNADLLLPPKWSAAKRRWLFIASRRLDGSCDFSLFFFFFFVPIEVARLFKTVFTVFKKFRLVP